MDLQKLDILRCFIGRVGTLLAACIAIMASHASAKPPNIILIMADDMGYESVGVYGGISSETPALDSLAAEGMRFEYAYSQPLCTPSRVKIMTGLFNFRNYVGWSKLAPGEATFARYFREQGYRTLLAGKWQLNSDSGQYPWDAENGFDEVITKRGPLPDGANPYWGRSMVIYQDGKRTNIDDAQAFVPDLCAAFMRDFIQRHAKAQQPFFAYRPMYLPHSPEVCTPDQGSGPSDCGLSNQERYTAMVEYLDKEVNSLLDLLEQLGIRDETLVIFTSDNGAIGRLSFELADGTIIQGGKGSTTDAGTRVPFIASWPGVIPMNLTNFNAIDFSVVTPTLLHAAIAPELSTSAMQGQLQRFDGPSILDQLRGEAGRPRGWAYNYYEPKRPANPNVFAEFVRDERYKLYRNGRFFDIQQDPLEKNALSANAGSLEANTVRTRLQGILDQIHTCVEVCKYNCRDRACAASQPPSSSPPAPLSPCEVVDANGAITGFAADGREVKLPTSLHKTIDFASTQSGYRLSLYTWYGSTTPFTEVEGSLDLNLDTQVKKIACEALGSPAPLPTPSSPCEVVDTNGAITRFAADGREVKLPTSLHKTIDVAAAQSGYRLSLYTWYGSTTPFTEVEGSLDLNLDTQVKKIACEALGSPAPLPTPSSPCEVVDANGAITRFVADGREVKLPTSLHKTIDVAAAQSGYRLSLYTWYGSTTPFTEVEGSLDLNLDTQVKKIACEAL